MRKLIIFIIGIYISSACVDPVSLDEDIEIRRLIVEGGITTEYGPHIISLSRSAKYGDVFNGVISNEANANLFIRDEFGNTNKLAEKIPGKYYTPTDFKGEVGTTYTLFINTSDGKEYQSIPELLTQVAEIDSIYYKYRKIPIIKTASGETSINGVDVIVRYTDDESASNYYKWETTGTFKILTHPELFTPPLSQTPVPKECCEVCYVDEVNNNISVSSDRLYNGGVFENDIVFVEDDGFRYSTKYILQVSQLSLSKEAYLFYELLDNQLSISGDIFDPPPATIRGNIICITNPDERVIGYFKSSDIRRRNFEIYGENLPELKNSPIVPDDCQQVINATVEVPDIW
jgi:hypothetical protein